jgi:hypothetical protein
MIGTLDNFRPEVVFGVVVTSRLDSYTDSAIQVARESKYNLLLTNLKNMSQDMSKYVFINGNPTQKILTIIEDQNTKLIWQEKQIMFLMKNDVYQNRILYAILFFIFFIFLLFIFKLIKIEILN